MKKKQEVKIVKKPKKRRYRVKTGRPRFDGKDEKDIRSKLLYAYDIGCNDVQAALHAEISISSLTRYKNEHPDFWAEIDLHKQKQPLKAKKVIDEALDRPVERVKTAMWVLEKREPDTYGNKSSVKIGEDSNNPFQSLIEAAKASAKELNIPYSRNNNSNETGETQA